MNLCLMNAEISLNKAKTKRSLILALVEDILEYNGNLNKLLTPLVLENVKYSVAFDLKCKNALLGLELSSIHQRQAH